MSGYRLIVAVAVWALLIGALLVSDAEPQLLVLGGFVFVVVAAGFIASDLVRLAAPLVWAVAPRSPIAVPGDEKVAVLALELRGSRGSWVQRDTLLLLVDERLLDRHGIDRSSQPAAAKSVLGSGLVGLIEQRETSRSRATDLHSLLDEIEAI